jgi:predicted 3-demethylubiquinone-9 3-methyltransferase (glyoxalase superfamily)
MPKITTFLTYNDQAENAVKFYVSIFKNSRIRNVTHYSEAGPGPKGSVMTVEFELDGQKFVALNGGSSFTFAQGVSLWVECETQEEIDRYWTKLSEGGEKQSCGWLQDKFGLSWQIAPTILGEMLSDPDPERTKRVMEAMFTMQKLDIEALKHAYEASAVTAGRAD